MTFSTPLRSRPRRALAVVATAAALLILPAAAASAHVHVHPDSTASGSFSALTFRVPDESATASTVKLVVQLPQDKPLLSVSVKPLPGWAAVVTQADLPAPVVVDGTTLTKAPRTVTWTANDEAAGVAPGQYQEFSISVGPLPVPGTLALPAVQTYSDGSVVEWDQPTPASGAEPDHPVPAFVVTASTGSDDGDPAGPAAAATSSGGSAGTWLGGGALAVSVLAAALAGLALAAARRTREAAAS